MNLVTLEEMAGVGRGALWTAIRVMTWEVNDDCNHEWPKGSWDCFGCQVLLATGSEGRRDAAAEARARCGWITKPKRFGPRSATLASRVTTILSTQLTTILQAHHHNGLTRESLTTTSR